MAARGADGKSEFGEATSGEGAPPALRSPPCSGRESGTDPIAPPKADKET